MVVGVMSCRGTGSISRRKPKGCEGCRTAGPAASWTPAVPVEADQDERAVAPGAD